MCLFLHAVKANSLQAVSCQNPLHTPSLVTPQRPEEDILFQWRLRRKIEQARGCSQSVQHSSLHAPIFTQQTQSINRPSASGSIYKVGLKVFVFKFKIFQICWLIDWNFIPCIVCNSSRVVRLYFHTHLHIHALMLTRQKPQHRVPQLQVHLCSQLLSFPGPPSLSRRPLPMYLLTCIFSAMSYPVPFSPLTSAGNKAFLKISSLTLKLAK